MTIACIVDAGDMAITQGNNYPPMIWQFLVSENPDVLFDISGSTFKLTLTWPGGSLQKVSGIDADADLMVDLSNSTLIWNYSIAETWLLPVGRVATYELERWINTTQQSLVRAGVSVLQGSPAPEQPPIPSSYQKIWADEFETFSMRTGGPTYAGLAAGTGVWTPTHHTTFDPKGSFFNGEYAYMVDPTYPWGGGYPALGQFAISNSILRIRGERTPAALVGQLPVNPVTSQPFSWVSGAMTTYESLKIGPPCYIETRTRLPRGKALWPAFWHIGIGYWPGIDHQEIDNVEQFQVDQVRFCTIPRSI
jgi:hypothetical protein